VHSFFSQNIPSTLIAVLEKVNNDKELPNFKSTTFYKLMKEIGFNYKQKKESAADRKKRHHLMVAFISEED
jgi:hypothetical protein